MANVLIDENVMKSIADAIRAKRDSLALVSGPLYPDNMLTSLDYFKNGELYGAYLFSKKETADGNTIGYAMCDDLDMYPNGGEQDGYYWNLIS